MDRRNGETLKIIRNHQSIAALGLALVSLFMNLVFPSIFSGNALFPKSLLVGYLIGHLASVLLASTAIVVGAMALAQLQGLMWKRVFNVAISVAAILAGAFMFVISLTNLVIMPIALLMQ